MSLTDQELSRAIERLWPNGSAIMLVEYDYLLVVVGYAQQIGSGRLFYVEASDLSTGHQHVLIFDSAEANGDMIDFRDPAGNLIATWGPFDEWPELGDMTERWAAWRADLKKWALSKAKEQQKDFIK